jgi:hypothetical protein
MTLEVLFIPITLINSWGILYLMLERKLSNERIKDLQKSFDTLMEIVRAKI